MGKQGTKKKAVKRGSEPVTEAPTKVGTEPHAAAVGLDATRTLPAEGAVMEMTTPFRSSGPVIPTLPAVSPPVILTVALADPMLITSPE